MTLIALNTGTQRPRDLGTMIDQQQPRPDGDYPTSEQMQRSNYRRRMT